MQILRRKKKANKQTKKLDISSKKNVHWRTCKLGRLLQNAPSTGKLCWKQKKMDP